MREFVSVHMACRKWQLNCMLLYVKKRSNFYLDKTLLTRFKYLKNKKKVHVLCIIYMTYRIVMMCSVLCRSAIALYSSDSIRT